VWRLIRNHHGKFIYDFMHSLGRRSIVPTEIWVIFYGLEFALDRGFNHIMLESDAFQVVSVLFNLDSKAQFQLVKDIRTLIVVPVGFSLNNTSKRKIMLWQMCLPKEALSCNRSLFVFKDPPAFVCNLRMLM